MSASGGACWHCWIGAGKGLPLHGRKKASSSSVSPRILGQGPIAWVRLAAGREWPINTDLGRGGNGIDKWRSAMLKSAIGAVRRHAIVGGAKTLLRSPLAL